jgi:CheY-like chemotaxis protein
LRRSSSILIVKMSKRSLVSIVEDDQFAREALEDLVRSLGYSVATFRSAEEYLLTGSLQTTARKPFGCQRKAVEFFSELEIMRRATG